MKSQLLIKVITEIKTVAGIEFVAILTVVEFNLAVVARAVRFDKLMANTEPFISCMEQGGFVL